MESQVCTILIKDAESKSIEVHIPQEIIENILTRLPLKSLIWFESVCKTWCSWLTNPSFPRRDAQSVLLLSTSKKVGFFQTITEQVTLSEKIPLPWTDSKSKVCVSNSCNGMVLICVGNSFYLFNPSTHFFVKVLTLDYKCPHNHNKSLYQMLIGLYYDEAISDYKVLVVIHYLCSMSSVSAIAIVEASLKEKRWNHIDHNNMMYYDELKVTPVLVDGRLHWLNNGVVLRFDPVLQVFENLPSFQPPLNRKKNKYHKIVGIGILDGCLSVARYYNKKRLEILVMKEYGVFKSWSPTLRSVGFLMKPCMNVQKCNPLLLTRAGEVLFSIKQKYFISTNEIWMYKHRKESCQEYLMPEKEILSAAVSFVPNMDTPSGYYWNQTEHENFGKTENFERMELFWSMIMQENDYDSSDDYHYAFM